MADRVHHALSALAAAAGALALAACGERADRLAELEAANRAQAAQVRVSPQASRSAGEVETYEGTPKTTATMGGPGPVQP